MLFNNDIVISTHHITLVTPSRVQQLKLRIPHTLLPLTHNPLSPNHSPPLSYLLLNPNPNKTHLASLTLKLTPMACLIKQQVCQYNNTQPCKKTTASGQAGRQMGGGSGCNKNKILDKVDKYIVRLLLTMRTVLPKGGGYQTMRNKIEVVKKINSTQRAPSPFFPPFQKGKTKKKTSPETKKSLSAFIPPFLLYFIFPHKSLARRISKSQDSKENQH